MPLIRLCLTAVLCLLVGTSQQRPSFHATVNGILVNVFVDSQGAPITGLTAEDFDLEDDGSKQRVTLLPTDGPLDVTVVLQSNVIMATFTDQLESAWRALVTALHPADRLRLLLCSDRVFEAQPFGPPPTALDTKLLRSTRNRQIARLTDGILDALAQPAQPERRPIVVVFMTDEGSEVFRASSLIDVASASDDVLYAISMPPWADIQPTWFEGVGQVVATTGGELFLGLDPNRKDDWRDAYRTEKWHGLPADALGGAVPATFKTATEAVRLVMEDVRRGYILSYVAPEGARPGWHNVSVRVLKPGLDSAVVRGRKKYLVTH